MSNRNRRKHWNARRFFGRKRPKCDCETHTDPDTGDIWHSTTCCYQWTRWKLRDRFRMWLLHLIPCGGVATFEADGTHHQRPMTADEHYDAVLAPVSEDSDLTRFQRLQRDTQRTAAMFSFRPEPPPWGHLGARSFLLACEGIALLKRFLLWAAPFTGTVYIIIELTEKCS